MRVADAAATEGDGSEWGLGGRPAAEVMRDNNTRQTTFIHLDQKGRLPLITKVAYALPAFGTTSLNFLVSVYATDFYVSMGANLAFLLFFTALARSFDVISDPLMAWVSDATRGSKFGVNGRRRPYMLTGAIPYGVLFFLLFSPPTGQELGLEDYGQGEDGGCTETGSTIIAYWFGFFYTLFFLLYTYTTVPYEALGPELSESYDERNQVFFIKKILSFLGTMFAAAGPAILKFLVREYQEVDVLCYSDMNSTFNPMSLVSMNSTKHSVLTAPHYCKNFAKECVETAAAYGKCLAEKACEQANSTLCYASGEFCFESPLAGGDTFLYFQQELEVIEQNCPAFDNLTSVGVEDLKNTTNMWKYEMSDLTAARLGFAGIAAMFGVYMLLTICLLVWKVAERPTSTVTKPVPLVPSILRSLSNKAFAPLLAGWALDGLGFSALVSTFPFYIRYVVIPDGNKARELGNTMSPDICMGVSVMLLLLAAVISSPIWLYAAGKIGKYKVWLAYNVISSLTNVLFMVPQEGKPMITIIIMAIQGLPIGGQFLVESILSDVIDYDEFLNGVRSEGAFSVFGTLIPKFVAIPAGAIPLAVVYGLGFVMPKCGVSQPQSEAVRNAISGSFILLPLLCTTIGFIIKSRFPLRTREMTDQIAVGIEKHELGQKAIDPITGHNVGLMEMTAEEEDKIWVFENFSAGMLTKLLSVGSKPLVDRMFSLTAISIFGMAAMVAVTAGTFSFLEDVTLSIIPIMSIITLGLFVNLTALNFIRYRGAKTLHTYFDKDTAAGFSPTNGPTYLLIKRLLLHKNQGQRGGRSIKAVVATAKFKALSESKKQEEPEAEMTTPVEAV